MPPPSFNLKQKLAALSIAQSAPSSPNSSTSFRNSPGDPYARTPTSPTTKRKLFTTPSWMKKNHSNHGFDHHGNGDVEKRMVQEVLSKMIFQAGVDFETRPMVVLNASALPDPQVISYDLLLSRILSYLNLYVEADYTVVFFAAGSRHAPSWNWVWKAYRSLSRKYRKNLKQLYIVHSSFFSKMLFSLAGAIISPKFFRKIVYITTLSELAHHVPLTQIDIPPPVYQENLKYERKISLPVPTRSSTFGVPLEDIMGYNGEKGGIPRVVKDAVQFLRDTGMQEEGLFRRSPSSAMLRAAQDAYDRGNVVSLETFGDPHIAAVLLKKYLRDLPEPIFPEATYATIRRCPMTLGNADEDAIQASIVYIREVILPELVPCTYILLSHYLHLLHDISLRSDTNRMDANNLAIVVCPNLVKGTNPMRDVLMCSVPISGPMADGSRENSFVRDSASNASDSAPGTPNLDNLSNSVQVEGKTTLGMVIALCIRRYYEIFDEVVDRSEAVAPWRALGSGRQVGDGDHGSDTYILGEDDDLEDDHDVLDTGAVAQQARMGAKRHRATLSKESNGSGIAPVAARSMYNMNEATSSSPSAWNHGGPSTLRSAAPNAFPTIGKAKSTISIEGGSAPFGSGTARGKGSIAIGRGTTRKGSGAAVSAVGVIAEGFFTAPGVPPIPKLPPSPPIQAEASKPSNSDVVTADDTKSPDNDEEERVLSFAERKKLFESGAS